MSRKITPLVLLGLGIFLLTQAVFPLLAYKIWEITVIGNNIPLISPASPSLANTLGVSVGKDSYFVATGSGSKRLIQPSFAEFHLSIDKIALKKALVKVDSNDLDNALAHLPGTALPGEIGNVFISGHSNAFAFLANNYYKSVFINLPKVKKGDEIILQVGGQRYSYKVSGMKIVEPTDLSIIYSPDPVGRYLTVMTCVPPGINTKRLVILAELE